jgi:ribosomal protein S18 acetylase RimI-like enzyme
MSLVDRLQSYLLEKERQQHEVISVPPFALLLDSDGNGVAVPMQAPDDDLREALEQLRSSFRAHQGIMRIRFVDAFAPRLALALQAAGLAEVSRAPLLVCTAETWLEPPAVPGLTFVVSSADSPLEEVKEGLDVNAQGFDPAAPASTDAEAEGFRRSLILSRAFTARLDGQGVAAGMFEDIRNDITELVGITTLAPFRRRGIAAALTAHMARIAFEHGASVAFLIAANQQAGRVYQRAGFQLHASVPEFRMPDS